MLQCKRPILHFAKGPLNTLLWYDIFYDELEDTYLLDYPPIQIYEIESIGKISHGICRDDYRLKQYGTRVIEFKERIQVSKIIKDATDVYERINPKIHNKNQAQSIKSWQRYVHTPELWNEYLKYEKQLDDALQHKR